MPSCPSTPSALASRNYEDLTAFRWLLPGPMGYTLASATPSKPKPRVDPARHEAKRLRYDDDLEHDGGQTQPKVADAALGSEGHHGPSSDVRAEANAPFQRDSAGKVSAAGPHRGSTSLGGVQRHGGSPNGAK